MPVNDEYSLSKAKIITDNFENLLTKINAKFIYVFNPNNLECRTWDNQGNVEDVDRASIITAWMDKGTSEIQIEGDVNFLVKGEIINI